jgi:hypothetical protein
MAAYPRPAKRPPRWALLAIAGLAALSMLVASAAALPPRDTSGGGQAPGGGVPPAAGPVRPPTPPQAPSGEPRYTVEVLNFQAIDESGADWSGSDEVFGIFGSTSGYNTRTRTHGDVDSGTFVTFAGEERCLTSQRVLSGGIDRGWLVAPGTRWECDPRGVPGPIGLRLELFEDDDCNAFFPSCFNTYVPPVRDPNDDLIGRVETTYSASELASRLPRVGNAYFASFTLGGPCGYQPPNHVCGAGPLTPTGPEYRLTIIIKRMKDAPPRATQ